MQISKLMLTGNASTQVNNMVFLSIIIDDIRRRRRRRRTQRISRRKEEEEEEEEYRKHSAEPAHNSVRIQIDSTKGISYFIIYHHSYIIIDYSITIIVQYRNNLRLMKIKIMYHNRFQLI